MQLKEEQTMSASLELLATSLPPEEAHARFAAAAVLLGDPQYELWKKGIVALPPSIQELAYVALAIDPSERPHEPETSQQKELIAV